MDDLKVQPSATVPVDLLEGYRETDIGILPEEWETAELGQLVDQGHLLIKNGFAQGAFNEEGQGVPHLRPFNVTSGGEMDFSQIKYVAPPPADSPHWLLSGDVVFNNTNSEDLVGKTAYFDSDKQCVLSNHMTLIRAFDTAVVDPRWLANQLHYLWETGLFKALCRRHVNQASVSLARLRSVRFPLPTSDEQRAIAYVLHIVQEVKETTEQVIEATRELKRSLMNHLFTYGPVPVDEAEWVPLKETEVGPVPVHWEVVRLGELCNVSTGTTPSTKKQEYYSGNIPFIKTSEIANNAITSATVHVNEQAVQDYRLKLYKPGTVFLAMYGQGKTRGQVSILNVEAATTQNTAAIVPNHGLDSHFLWTYLMSQYQALRGEGIHGHISHLNLGYVKKLTIPLPPYAEQCEMARIISAVNSKERAEENRKRSLEILFKTLLHNLMTGKVRVTDLDLSKAGELA